jgi:hypothetical protein
MSFSEIIIRLVAVVLLTTYLLIKDRQRLLRQSGSQNPTGKTGTPIDVTALIPSVDRARQDCRAGRVSLRSTRHREELRALARRTVEQRTYFRASASGDDARDRSATRHSNEK